MARPLNLIARVDQARFYFLKRVGRLIEARIEGTLS